MPDIDDVLRQGIDSGAAAGVAAAATTDSGTIYEGAFGVREIGKPASMTPDTVVWIASMTKAITAMAAMQLVERGKLSLDEPIGKLLPQLANPQVFEGFDSAGKPKLRPAKGAITLRQLLTHTAGFSYDIWNADLGKHMEAAGIPGIISCQNAALSTPLTFDPGTRWDYGINIDWVGKAIEAASGEKLDAYLRKNVFEPLGMASTSFKLNDDQRSRLSGMHARGEDGKLAAMPFEIPQEPEFHMGGGGLYGTVQDYLKFVHCLLNDGAPLVSKKTFAEMARNNIGDINVVALKTAAAPYSADADFFPGIQCKWGLSFLINTATTPQGRSPGSLAWAGLANTFFWADPVKKIGGVFATQTLPFFDPRVIGMFRDYESAVYRSL
ncbi:MAG: beta-lactamase family protein [Alphaproteobacteria bacterium]|nr:beta-lactamase family protein [Alphaproteobacteria bacterium]MCW5741844.1 beta-lactamase family protein [Alphaproteobacteria bacterium]